MFFCPGLISFILVNCSPILVFFGRACTEWGSRQGVNFNLKRKETEYISGCWWIKMYKIVSFGWMLTASHKYSLLNGRTKAKSVHLANPRSQCKGHSTSPFFFLFWVLCLTFFFNRILRWDFLYLCTEIVDQIIVWRWYFEKINVTLSCLFWLYVHCFLGDDFFSGTVTRVTLWEHTGGSK